jgi:hypothetical protein
MIHSVLFPLYQPTLLVLPRKPAHPTHLLTSANPTLRNKLALLAHLASQPRPAPSKFPHRTALAIPSDAGTWKNVDAVERSTD